MIMEHKTAFFIYLYATINRRIAKNDPERSPVDNVTKRPCFERFHRHLNVRRLYEIHHFY